MAAGTAGTAAAAGGGAVENGKMEKQPTNRTITKYHPPLVLPPPAPCLLQARKIYSEKYILQFSSDFGPQGAALATLVEQQSKGWGGGCGDNTCVTLSDSLQGGKEEGASRVWVGWRTNKTLDKDFDKINFID